MTKLSKAYFGFRRVSLREGAATGSGVSSTAGRTIGTAERVAPDWMGIGAVRCVSISSGLTTTRKVVAAGSASTCAMASMMGPRRRLLSVSAVSEFGTSRYRVPPITPCATARLRNPCIWGVTRSSPSRCSSTAVHTGTSGTSC